MGEMGAELQAFFTSLLSLVITFLARVDHPFFFSLLQDSSSSFCFYAINLYLTYYMSIMVLNH